jgi:hypothetical protein
VATFVVDTTPPLHPPGTSVVTTTTPSVTVSVSGGLTPPDGTAVRIDADLDSDGTFGAQRAEPLQGQFTGGSATFWLNPLPTG